MGYAFDSSRGAIRGVRGVPGAAILGDPLDLGTALSGAVIAPSQGWALVSTPDDPQPKIAVWNGVTPSISGVDNAMATPDRMVFSPVGTAALLVSNQNPSRLQVLTGLPRPGAAEDIDLGGFPGTVGSVAVSDDGTLILLSGAGQSWMLDSSRNRILLPMSGGGMVFSFQRDRHDAVAMSASGDLYSLQGLDSALDARLIAAGSESSAGAVALWLSADGGHAYSVTGAGSIVSFEMASGVSQLTACGCSPTGIHPLNSRLLRLTEVGSRPMYVLDSSDTPRIWFVPPDARQVDVAGGVQ